MALCSYESLHSSWETEPFSRGAGSDFRASGSLQTAHCQNNPPLSGHIHLLPHSPAQPSSFPDAAQEMRAARWKHCVTDFSPRRPPEPCGCWEGGESHPQLFRHQAPLSPPHASSSWEVRKIPFLHKCVALLAAGQADLSRAGVSFLGQIFLGFFLFSAGKLSCMHI